ncbi:MAG: hypothetical protein BGN86_02475 [Caulobacterales bacterium 68-7]|nr:CocE/NonD family hydrolase [Caulobacterales bacterium]OJU08359.1 MAG: hypothetical protein BGN86_02475 [Caulobacterales bacterium 68-7]
MILTSAVAGVVLGLSAVFNPLVDRAAERIFASSDPAPRQYSVTTRRKVEAVMDDGVVLRADVHTPAGLQRAPTILIRIPFTNTLWNRLRSDAIGRFWAARGYVVVVQGARGRYGSDGAFTPLEHERKDGVSTLRWLAKQPWYDGRIGMWGGSAFGQTQWAIADQTDPGAQAFFIQIAGSHFYDMMHPGGATALESALQWALASDGPRERKVDYAALDLGAATLDTLRADNIAAGHDIGFFDAWVAAPRDGAYWRASDGEDRATTAAAPVLLLGGWYDPFLPGMLRDFAALRAHTASADSRLVIGPYGHARDLNWPGGDLDQPYRQASVTPALAWFDHRLRGAPLASPRVRLFVMGENVWRDEAEWPLARTRYTSFYLGDGGALSTMPPSSSEAADRYAYDPRDPAPTAGGAILGERGGITRQLPMGARADVLNFVTEPLAEPLEVTGPLRTVLWVSTDAPSTDFTAKLSFVDTTGSAYNLADGIVRQAYQPGVPTRVEIDLGATSIRLPAGYRLRLDISSSNHPRFDRNPNTGEPTAGATRSAVAHQMVWRTAVRASHIELPVIPR